MCWDSIATLVCLIPWEHNCSCLFSCHLSTTGYRKGPGRDVLPILQQDAFLSSSPLLCSTLTFLRVPTLTAEAHLALHSPQASCTQVTLHNRRMLVLRRIHSIRTRAVAPLHGNSTLKQATQTVKATRMTHLRPHPRCRLQRTRMPLLACTTLTSHP